ncbi:MAG: polysaccharide biosynthesis/export family protein [Burkholderiaceae bacterium]|jgi:polysaccharide export outer membrane protein|nr:polysaccharide biosynthesis/export family protein [Burkholderiaceae bacterium]
MIGTITRFCARSSLPGLLIACLLVVLAGCTAAPPRPVKGSLEELVPKNGSFKPAVKSSNSSALMTPEELALIEEMVNPPYLIGPGDVVKVDVFGRPEVSGPHTVGPDGKVTVPLMGVVTIADLTREQAQSEINQRLRTYFARPVVTVSITDYTSNTITVLGRVERAGALKFPQPPTLVDVLASSGAMPILDKQATLTRVAIIRGRDRIMWVDAKALLNGDLRYNIRLKKNDVVFIPDSSDTSVYVLGQVPRPGSYRLTPRMSVLDALAQAGGPTNDAAQGQIALYRAGTEELVLIPLANIIDPSRAQNYALEDGDVIYVPSSGLADFGYFMRQISPFFNILLFSPPSYWSTGSVTNNSTTVVK